MIGGNKISPRRNRNTRKIAGWHAWALGFDRLSVPMWKRCAMACDPRDRRDKIKAENPPRLRKMLQFADQVGDDGGTQPPGAPSRAGGPAARMMSQTGAIVRALTHADGTSVRHLQLEDTEHPTASKEDTIMIWPRRLRLFSKKFYSGYGGIRLQVRRTKAN